MSKVVEQAKIWRVDVSPTVFLAVVGERSASIGPLYANKLYVLARTRGLALKKAWEVVKDCGLPVSKEDLNVGEGPSIIECFVR